ncbi:hypothetical protein [Formosa algae]|uniref:hypothetical protein n=1 Tax=Formosa algae TaxID=225843 RepID=UPI000CCEEEFB|nr:hypothetical protein [Formosa algae]PNW26187.1 hypothetical protein BKP44_17830 [Formosa algae]
MFLIILHHEWFTKNKKIIKSTYINLVGNGQTPIFILGTGRCGSTLLVDILMTNKALDINQQEQYDWFLTALPEGQKHKPLYTDLINYRLTADKSLAKWNWYYRKN